MPSALWGSGAPTRAVALAVRLNEKKGGGGVGWSWLIMSLSRGHCLHFLEEI